MGLTHRMGSLEEYMDRLTALHSFIRLVELGSFTRVAEEARVKQSTVSKWLKTLESEVGVPLMHRTTRVQQLTEAGERLYREGKEVLAAYEGALAAIQAKAPTLQGRVVLSVPVVFGRRHILPLLASFLQEHPLVELDLRLDDRYVNLVKDGVEVNWLSNSPGGK